MGNKKNNYLPVDELIDKTFNRIKDVIDANTIIGQAIVIAENISIIPISKVSVGVVSGGSEIPRKKKNNMSMTAGSSSGFTISPIGFIAVNGDRVDYISTVLEGDSTSKYLNLISNMVEMFIGNKERDNEEV